MSDRAGQPHPIPNGSEMSTNLKQSAWMRHWMQPKHKGPRDANICLENKDERETTPSLSCNQVTEPSGSMAVNGSNGGAESRSFEVIHKIITDGSHSKKERSDLLSFPIFNIHTKGGSNSKQDPGSQTGQCSEFNAAATGTVIPHYANAFGRQLQEIGIATTGCKLFPKETTPNLELQLRSCDSAEGSCIPAVKSARGELPGLPSDYPCGIMYRKEKVTPFASTSKDHMTNCSSYNDFNIGTEKITRMLDAREDIHLGRPIYTETTRHFLITEKMAIGVSDEGKIFRESMLSTKFSGNLGGFLSLSPASGQVRPGLKLQLLDGSTDSEQKGRCSEENQKDEGSQSIGRLNTEGVLMDETSAGTRTMEVDVSLENNQTIDLSIWFINFCTRLQYAGAPPSVTAGVDEVYFHLCRAYSEHIIFLLLADLAVYRSNKTALLGHDAVSSQGKSTSIGLPDMNEAAHASDGSANERERSSSRTRSLDMECLVSNNDCPSNSKSNPSHVVQPRTDLGSRWVKRLKPNDPCTKYAALGTKASTIEKASSYEKLRKLSSNLLNRSNDLTNSGPLDTHLRNTSESKKTAEDRNLLNCRKGSSVGPSKEDRNALLSHSWIQRWRHDQTRSSKKQALPSEPPETLKVGSDHFQKKSFPSIAAMALMGKAMNGFGPCEFTKKGSSIVWNTNNLPND